MRKFLRSPLAVSIMALLAIGIVYTNVIAPLQSKPALSSFVADDPAIYTIKPIAPVQHNELTWQVNKTRRNPFAVEHLTATPVTRNNIKSTRKKLHLSAILSDSQNPLALISGQLVGIHDTIDGFTVLSITQNHVQLQQHNKQQTLFLPQDSRR